MRTRNVLSIVVCLSLVAMACSEGSRSVDPAGDRTSLVDEPATTAAPATPAAPPAVEPAAAAPGHFVRLRHDSLVAREPVTVEVSTGTTPVDQLATDRFSIEYQLTPIVDGEVAVLIPPLFDPITARHRPGVVSLSIPGTDAVQVSVTDLPAAAEPPGTVVAVVLTQAVADLADGRPRLEQLRINDGIDTSEAVAALDAVMADLNAVLTTLSETGTLALSGGSAGTVILAADELAEMDRLLTGYLDGLIEELGSAPGVTTGGPGEHATTESSDVPTTTEERIALIRRLREQINGGATVFTSAAAMLVTAIAAFIGSAAFGASALFAFVAGVATTVTIGVAAEALAAIEAYLTGESWEFGSAFAGTMLEAFLNLAVALGTEASAIVNLGSFLYSGHEVAVGLHQLVCTGNPIPERYREFCDASRDLAGPRPLSMNRAWFSPGVIAPGLTGTLYVPIDVGPTHDAIVNIEWGDGSEDTTETIVHDGVARFSHLYVVEGGFIIRIHAIDANGDEAFESAPVNVTAAAGVSVSPTEVPVQLLTLDSFTWGFELAGGQPGYTVTVGFGDGSTEALEFGTTGNFAVSHAYQAAGEYAVRVDVTDALGATASATVPAAVHEPVVITSLAGPTQVDPGETGTWSVEIGQGWGPYDVMVYWGDGTDPFTGSSEGIATFSHQYRDRGTFGITAIATDATGLSAEADVDVEVPRRPIEWTGNGHQDCQSPNDTWSLDGPISGSVSVADREFRLLADATGFTMNAPIADDGTFHATGTWTSAGMVSNWELSGTVTIDLLAATASGTLSGSQTWPDQGVTCIVTGTFG